MRSRLEDPKVFTHGRGRCRCRSNKRLDTSPRVLEYYCYGFSDVFTLPRVR
jgi:hypothetical protein